MVRPPAIRSVSAIFALLVTCCAHVFPLRPEGRRPFQDMVANSGLGSVGIAGAHERQNGAVLIDLMLRRIRHVISTAAPGH
jgi:hypothetical protein